MSVTGIGMSGASVAIIVIATLSGVTIAALPSAVATNGFFENGHFTWPFSEWLFGRQCRFSNHNRIGKDHDPWLTSPSAVMARFYIKRAVARHQFQEVSFGV
jgi:hypothetical protein